MQANAMATSNAKPAGATQPAKSSAAAPTKGNVRFVCNYKNTRAHGGRDQLRFEAASDKVAEDAARKCTGQGYIDVVRAAKDDNSVFFTWDQLVAQFGL